ncbi:hypothetical protein BS47DRAFT_1362265 [Hydnum rufescens UP504]|uniref:FAD-binding domain-containing protein n=1 Tax=Hydnum rufescens UP504 TaxID=1448309 RepID=A0A9P6DWG8_9AGAM|nr:hypothetical protein BS47DRAFT_1362265 [Hydnum rufescens UP504]
MSCHAYPNVVSGSPADHPAEHPIADLVHQLVSARRQPLRAHGTPNRPYEEYRSVGAGPCTSPLPNTKSTCQFLTDVDDQGGLAATLVLRKKRIIVRLTEKALDNQIGVRGTGIQPRILELSVHDPGSGHRHSIEPPQMNDGKLSLGRRTLSNPQMLCQCSTEATLGSHLSLLGVTVELGTELVDFTQDTYKVTTNLLPRNKRGSSQNEALKVDWRIRADGARGLLENTSGSTSREKRWRRKLSLSLIVLALPMGPAPHFSVLGNGTPEEIQKVVHGGFHAFKAYLRKILIVDQTFDALTSFASVVCSSPEARISATQGTLNLTTDRHTQWMLDRGLALKDTSQDCQSGFRARPCIQATGSYQWSGIILDRRLILRMSTLETRRTRRKGRTASRYKWAIAQGMPSMSCPSPPRVTLLFNLLTHTALVFELPESPPTDTEPLAPFNQ